MSAPDQLTAAAVPPAWLQTKGLMGILLLWIGTLLFGLAMVADGVVRAAHQDRAAADLIHQLHLTAPAFYPAGHPLRHPGHQSRGIPSHYTPLMPLALVSDRWEWFMVEGVRWEQLP
ncbi:MAG: hypothetical protein QNJ22_05630 [Desulfosarcinaceae bacterium]|nr:hypothetical protein [Desulfosarcinaceae bacterium]